MWQITPAGVNPHKRAKSIDASARPERANTPPERAWIGRAMHSRDVQRLREDLDDGVRLANSLGLDVSDVELPIT